MVFQQPVPSSAVVPGSARSTSDSTSPGSVRPREEKKYERLPLNAAPKHYSLTLSPNLVECLVAGKVDIDVSVKEQTKSLQLHAHKGMSLEVVDASIRTSDGTVHEDLTVDHTPEMMTVHTPTLSPGDVTLSISFFGEIGSDVKGFYRRLYKGADGKDKVIASTQFETTFARRAFPCWDEPLYKATFDVTLIVDPHLTALSNMQVLDEGKNEQGKRVFTFARTPIMSTYLLAFAVGEFEYIESKTKGGVTMRAYTVPGKHEQGRFALDLATKAIDWYNDWFGIQYPIPKCDLLAVPDFHIGAMENWGLITFREAIFLFKEGKSSNRMKANVGLTTAHELAYLWFGDLVTMKWWTDMWLKEGFASFMEYTCIHHNYPEFKIWLKFAHDEIAIGMTLDALKSSHPIEVEVDNPIELDEIYDSITFSKSNCCIRMLCSFLGEDTFQKGIRDYLNSFAYSNADTEDLWAAIGKASGQDIKMLMSGWTKQTGFPLVRVDEKENGDQRTLTLTQERFIADGSKDDANTLWMVPITILKQSNPSNIHHKLILKDRSAAVTVDGVAKGEAIKLNASTGGFYRVLYSDTMFANLIKGFHSLPPLDRYGFVSDVFALMKAGHYTASHFLDLLASCSGEEEYAVWGAIDDGLSALSNVIQYGDEELKKRLNALIISLLSPVLARLGWSAVPGEDPQRAELRGLVISRLSKAGQPEVIQKALALYDANPIAIDPNMRCGVYATVARSGSPAQYKELRTIFETSGFSEIERHCILALGQRPNKDDLAEVFEYAVDQGKVRSQDLFFLFAGASAGRVEQEYTWEYFKNNQPKLCIKLGGVKNSLYQRCFMQIIEGFCSEEKAKEVEALFGTHPTKNAKQILDRPIRQSTEIIRTNQRLLAANAEPISKWLSYNSF